MVRPLKVTVGNSPLVDDRHPGDEDKFIQRNGRLSPIVLAGVIAKRKRSLSFCSKLQKLARNELGIVLVAGMERENIGTEILGTLTSLGQEEHHA